MMIYFLSIATINLNYFIDGLSNVESHVNATNQEITINIKKRDVFFFYQDMPNFVFTVFNNNTQARDIENGYQIPENSIIKISGNWDEIQRDYNDTYLIGFYDGTNCDLIFYSNVANELFPLNFFPNKKKCVYHFCKNSIDAYSPKVQAKHSKTFLSSFNSRSIIDRSQEIKGIIKVARNKLNLLEDTVNDEEDDIDEYGFKYKDHKLSLILGITVGAIGLILYILCAYVFGTDFSFCCNHCDKSKFVEKVNDPGNKFYSETLVSDFPKLND